jgi:radical SAM-linked protein
MRRWRLTFTKGEPVRYISHLDLMRTWERILRRAGLKLAHSQGFNPRPKLVFAAPLPVGVTSDAELLDVILEDELGGPELLRRLQPALAPGIEVKSADEVPLEVPPVMASALSAAYVVELEDAEDVEHRLDGFLAQASVPYERSRKGRTKQGDMRPSVLDLTRHGPSTLFMTLRLDVEGAAVRPEEVVGALDPGWRVVRVHRTGLSLKEEATVAHAA